MILKNSWNALYNVYVPKSNVVSVKDARWIRFKMNSSNIALLPPSPGAFHQHILRSYWQAKIWINAKDSHPCYLDPEKYGWYTNDSDNDYKKVISENPIAPSNILELTLCSCDKSRCSSGRYKCRALGEICTDLCQCKNCENCDIYVQEAEDEQFDTADDV